jgi:lipopolysaccharide export system permease protein
MPRLLYTYLINQVLAPFYASLLILSSILFLGKLIPLLNVILDYNIGLPDFIRLYLYFTPQLLLFALPMSSMLGVTLGTTHINNDNELMALRASGVSLYKMLPPVVMVALGTAIITGIFSIYLIPAGSRAKVDLAFQLATDRIERSLHEKRFSESLGDIVLYADRIDPETRSLHGVFITDMRDQKHPVTIISQGGRISKDAEKGIISIALTRGSFNRDTDNVVQTISFDSYDLNLPVETPQTSPLAKIGKSTMLQSELLAAAKQAGENTTEGAALLNAYHERLVLPVCCFILTILGFPLGFLSGSRHRTIGIPLALIIFILFFVMLTAAKALSESLLLPAALAMWLPNLLFLIFTVYFVRTVARENHTRLLEIFYDIPYLLMQKLGLPGRRLR